MMIVAQIRANISKILAKELDITVVESNPKVLKSELIGINSRLTKSTNNWVRYSDSGLSKLAYSI